MNKKERELVITILVNYMTTKEKTLLTREEYQMLKKIVEKLSKED